jgi:hypothetical protein
MRAILALAVVFMMATITLPATAQQPTPPAAPVQKTDPAKPSAEPETKTRTSRIRHRHARHAVRHRRESICSIVNGWRAFDNPYDPKNCFYTGRVCCCG